MIKEAIDMVVQGVSLSEQQMHTVMGEIMSGNATDAQIASFVTALRVKGETIEEISGAAKVMREKAVTISTGHEVVLDTCGTGGDRKGTFNVSTAVAFVAAGAGVRVAKHGNRSVSSKSGSADVLEALGININTESAEAERLLDTVGMCFLFAPLYNRAMKYAIGPRREIGIRTIFNMLGPLTNPAGARYQLIGVYDRKLTETIAHVLHNLGSVSACVVHGSDGTDEVTMTGTTNVSELRHGTITSYTFNPEDFGYRLSSEEVLSGGDARYNASILEDVLSGTAGPMRDMTEINSAFALYITGMADNIRDAISLARDVIDSGRAAKKLEELRRGSASAEG
ncbi:MAG: anthranilate phosphoribosyltransferase [Deltaproteobacteria bacterium]|nr:anthranilate phosphoribosyltransferase [Deltaproteobacteria bacterium]MCL5277440.1 anthranilate phosphoribosyltransferase [Deltaproteobacteria bacterium]